jgi:multiple sugar transport system permease protein
MSIESKPKRNVARLFTALLLVLFLFPIYYLLTTALKARLLAFAVPPVWLFVPTIENFQSVLANAAFLSALLNSTVACLASTTLALVFGGPAGYYLARARGKRKERSAGWILSTRMAPPIVVIIPFFLIVNKLGMFDRISTLVIIYLVFNLPLVVLIMRSFFEDVPVEFDEAGMVDGLKHPGIFWRIVLPMCKQGLISTWLLCFLLTWNEFLFALILTGKRARTMPVLVTGYIQQTQGLLWSEMAAASVIIMLPIVIFIFFVQKNLARGMTLGMMRDLK